MLKILKSAQILTKTYETFAEQLQSLSEQVTSFSINTELYPKEPIIESFAQSLLLFAKPFKDLFKVWQEKMTIPMEKFVKEDFGIYLEQLNDLRAKVLKSMETYRKVKTETEKFKNKTLKTKKVMELEAAVTGFHTMTNEYADQLRTMTSISRLQFNHILLSAVEVYFQHFENGKDIKNELASQYLLQRSEIEEEKEELEKREATYKRNLRFKSSDPEAKHGFLYLKFSTARRPWKMRHIIVNNNILKVYKLWKENSDTTVDCEFDLKICTIKAFPDKQPYCFEIIHAQRRPVVFRARNQTDYQGWLQIIQAAIAGAIISIDYFSQKRLSVMPQLSEALLLIRQEQSNLHCAECSASDPSWTSINTGAKICIECAGIHRSLGTHDSKVRSFSKRLLKL
uniref:Arf-GAP domain-containing protein n=1 Tax=Arcella intermedia TaxID=1963864 RepID=A0A6B2L5S7_9EUKA